MLLDPMTATSSSTEKCLECKRGRVEVDLDAGFQQSLVVGVLSVVDHELITLLAHEELDVDTALRCCRMATAVTRPARSTDW